MVENNPRIQEELVEMQQADYAEARRIVLSDSPDGFGMYFGWAHNHPLPDHALSWIDGIYEAHAQHKGIAIEAFRYSSKTTILTQHFTSYRIGLEPAKTNLLIQIGDDMANDNSSKVADIIESNSAWKIFFPHVVPDTPRGWGQKGYHVKLDDIDYAEWIREQGKDPTFVGYGYDSSVVIGRHPNGVLVVDDINNQNNTTSVRELERVNKVLTSTIFPTIDPTQTWIIFVGTPWVRDDAIDYVKKTGRFVSYVKPIAEDKDGKPKWPGGEPVWPERFGPEEIEFQRELNGEMEFARMFLCSREAAEGLTLRREWLREYPFEKISDTWPVLFGVDYASTSDKSASSRRDFFSLSIGAVTPEGKIVLIDGVHEHFTQAEAEQCVISQAKLYEGRIQLIGIENVGSGMEFYNLMLRRAPMLPFFPCKTYNHPKAFRFEKQMAPLWQRGQIMISDAVTPYLQVFRKEWCVWHSPNEHDDTLDATFYMTDVATQGYVNFQMAETGTLAPKRKQKNPFTTF